MFVRLFALVGIGFRIFLLGRILLSGQLVVGFLAYSGGVLYFVDETGSFPFFFFFPSLIFTVKLVGGKGSWREKLGF